MWGKSFSKPIEPLTFSGDIQYFFYQLHIIKLSPFFLPFFVFWKTASKEENSTQDMNRDKDMAGSSKNMIRVSSLNLTYLIDLFGKNQAGEELEIRFRRSII